MTDYVFQTRVIKIEKKKRAVKARKIGDDIDVEYEDLGWFVLLDGAVVSIALGFNKPELDVGQKVELVIRASRMGK